MNQFHLLFDTLSSEWSSYKLCQTATVMQEDLVLLSYDS
jgi:hypothetical protein